MPKFVYIGTMIPRGPYRGESAEDIVSRLDAEIEVAAKSLKAKPADVRQDVLGNLVPW